MFVTKNPVQGVRAVASFFGRLLLVQPRLAWGAFSLATSETGPRTRFGVGTKTPTVKSSTMRGAKALASESDRRRCRTAKNLLLMGKGGASVFCPPKSSGWCSASPWRKLCRAGRRGHTATGPWVTPLSDVNDRMEVKANTGTTAAAGVVAGAWLGQPSAQNAVVGESGLSRSGPHGPANRLQGSGLVVCALGWYRATLQRRKG